MTETPANPPDFERALGELEATVDKLEHGDLSLEESSIFNPARER